MDHGPSPSDLGALSGDLAVEKLGPIGAEMKKLHADTAYIDAVLKDGSDRARVIARQNMESVKDILGLLR